MSKAEAISAQQHGALTVLRPRGPLTFETSGRFASAASEAVSRAAGRVAFDLEAVTFVDSDGLEALLDTSDRLGEIGQPTRLIAVNETVREAMSITGIDASFHFFGSASEAALESGS